MMLLYQIMSFPSRALSHSLLSKSQFFSGKKANNAVAKTNFDELK